MFRAVVGMGRNRGFIYKAGRKPVSRRDGEESDVSLAQLAAAAAAAARDMCM
jgi:hypothetical protein